MWRIGWCIVMSSISFDNPFLLLIVSVSFSQERKDDFKGLFKIVSLFILVLLVSHYNYKESILISNEAINLSSTTYPIAKLPVLPVII